MLSLAFLLLPPADSNPEPAHRQIEAMEILMEIMKIGTTSNPPIDSDSHERVTLCLSIIENANSPMAQVTPRRVW